MAKNTQKKQETDGNTADSHLLFAPERRVIGADAARRMAERCSEYNDSRSECRDFNCVEIRGVNFSEEDLSGVEAHYGKFTDCEFVGCKFNRMEAQFAEFENCTFKNCELENAQFPFVKMTDVVFFNSNLDGADFPFAQGNFSCTGCMMSRCTAQNAALHLVLSAVNAGGFEANSAHLELDVTDSNFRCGEFNDGVIRGRIVRTDLTRAELNRSDLTELELADCASSGMETEDATGLDNSLDDDLSDLFDDEDEDE